MLVEAGTHPDVVLTDAELPLLSGAALARRLRAEVPALPSIVMLG